MHLRQKQFPFKFHVFLVEEYGHLIQVQVPVHVQVQCMEWFKYRVRDIGSRYKSVCCIQTMRRRGTPSCAWGAEWMRTDPNQIKSVANGPRSTVDGP